MSLIIPDTIEPWLGYKALRMHEGHLCSPSQYAKWPKREPLEAACTLGKRNDFRWKLTEAPPGWEGMFWVSSAFLTEGATTTFSWPPNEPPEGFTWIPELTPHNLAKCQCGIYAVDQPTQAHSYMTAPDRVLVEVALWGQVVLGDRGARGQYAYPQRMYAAEQQTGAAELAYEYDIPIEIVRFYNTKENDE